MSERTATEGTADTAGKAFAAVSRLEPGAATAATSHLLYLHGFRSSPASFKARMLANWVGSHRPQLQWWCPQLPPSPATAWALIQAGIADWPRASMAVVGSSLGGFYATAVAEATGCRALLLNPAVDPARDLQRHLGEQTQWHDPSQRVCFTAEHVAELGRLVPPRLTRLERYAAVIARGDEVLDAREMCARYAGATLRLLDAGDHGLSDFEQHLPFALGWLGLIEASAPPTGAN